MEEKEYKENRQMPGCVEVHSPFIGKVIPLSKVHDERFREEKFGTSVVVKPKNNLLYAPFTGVLTQVSENRSCVVIRHACGIEVMLHIGIDTAFLNAHMFTTLVEPGSQVLCGQPIVAFDRKHIRKKGFTLATPVIVLEDGRDKDILVLRQKKVDLDSILMIIDCS